MDKNEEKAYKYYEEGGYSAVIDACNEGKLKYDAYGLCEPCDSEQPIYKDACLSCGSYILAMANIIGRAINESN